MPHRFLQLHFEGGFQEAAAATWPHSDYCTNVCAELEDGSLYQLSFFGTVRIWTELGYLITCGQPYVTEPGLIVLPEMTREAMEAAAQTLAAEGFLERYLARSPRVELASPFSGDNDPPRRTLRRLVHDVGFDEAEAQEVASQGFCTDVWAELDDGSQYPMSFYDITRIGQLLEYNCLEGRRFFTKPGLVALYEVTPAHMEAAARRLTEHGFFQYFMAPRSGTVTFHPPPP